MGLGCKHRALPPPHPHPPPPPPPQPPPPPPPPPHTHGQRPPRLRRGGWDVSGSRCTRGRCGSPGPAVEGRQRAGGDTRGRACQGGRGEEERRGGRGEKRGEGETRGEGRRKKRRGEKRREETRAEWRRGKRRAVAKTSGDNPTIPSICVSRSPPSLAPRNSPIKFINHLFSRGVQRDGLAQAVQLSLRLP